MAGPTTPIGPRRLVKDLVVGDRVLAIGPSQSYVFGKITSIDPFERTPERVRITLDNDVVLTRHISSTIESKLRPGETYTPPPVRPSW